MMEKKSSTNVGGQLSSRSDNYILILTKHKKLKSDLEAYLDKLGYSIFKDTEKFDLSKPNFEKVLMLIADVDLLVKHKKSLYEAALNNTPPVTVIARACAKEKALAEKLIKCGVEGRQGLHDYVIGSKATPVLLNRISEAAKLALYSREITKVKKTISELRAEQKLLYEAMETFGYLRDLDQLYESITDLAVRMVKAEAGSLLLLDKSKRQLEFKIVYGQKAKLIKNLTLNLGEGIAGAVAQTGKAQIINEVQKDPRFNKKIDKSSGFITRNLLCVPLMGHSEIIGVLELVNKRNEAGFNAKDLSLIYKLVNQMGTSIENAFIVEEQSNYFFHATETIIQALEVSDPYCKNHARNTACYASFIATKLELSTRERRILHFAAIMHDIGKIRIHLSTLLNPGQLSSSERLFINLHPIIGARIIEPITMWKECVALVLHHHERWDGSGYPDGLQGESIPLGSRIIAVAESYDAMISGRPYQPALSHAETIEELIANAGIQFDPEIVNIFSKYEPMRKIKLETSLQFDPLEQKQE